MKQITILIAGFFLLMSMSLNAQITGSFIIKLVNNKPTLTGDISKSYDAIEIKFDPSLGNSKVGVYSSKQTKPVFTNKKIGKNDEDIQAGTDGEYKITILSSHKIKEFPEITQEVPDSFKVKVNKTFLGPFVLESKSLPESTISLSVGKESTGESRVFPHYKTGFLLYDAMYLNDNWNKKTKIDTIRLILRNYSIKDSNELKKNQYLQSVFKGLYAFQFKSVSGVQGGSSLGVASLLSSVGGLDVTNIADGFAKFLVKRTKQELSVAFFKKFQDAISQPQFADIRTLFPQTYRALMAIGDRIYNYEAYILTLREVFENDLASLPSNLPAIIDNHKDFFMSTPALRMLRAELLSGFYIAGSFQEKQHPGEIIENYPPEILDSLDVNVKAALQTLQLLSVSLKSNAPEENYWAPAADIKKIFSDEQLLKIYTGLLEQKAKMGPISFRINKDSAILLSMIIDNSFQHIPSFRAYVRNLTLKVSSLESKVKSLKQKGSDSLLFENYNGVATATIDLLKYCIEINKFSELKDTLNLKGKTIIYFDIAQTSCDIAIDVNRRNYSSAIVNGIHLYTLIFDSGNINGFISATYRPSNADQTDVQREKGIIEQQKLKSDSVSKIVDNLFQFGSFMATVVQAKSSDDVEKAIEAAALPSGSSRVKRETPFNVSLNAYTGLFIGYEKIVGMDDKHVINNYGVTAPIGVAISSGSHSFLCLFPKREGHWSYSAFISLIDIGAVASFRFQNNDSVAQIPTIKLQDIFSPGLFFSIGIPKCPLSVNMGAQVGPNLRNVNVKDEKGNIVNVYQNNVYWRFSASLVVDIPIFNFYTKPKN